MDLSEDVTTYIHQIIWKPEVLQSKFLLKPMQNGGMIQ